MRYIYNQPQGQTMRKIKSTAWGFVAVLCALEVITFGYLATNHTPAAVEAQNESQREAQNESYVADTVLVAPLLVTTSDNTNITEMADIQAAGGYRLLQEEATGYYYMFNQPMANVNLEVI